jgi:hypothetical protein
MSMKNGINLWIDDVRNPAVFSPHYEWVWVKTAPAAIAALETGAVERISLDHDLGLGDAIGSGYTVAKFIEEAAFLGNIPRLNWSLHSQNPVGVTNMRAALTNADRYWKVFPLADRYWKDA